MWIPIRTKLNHVAWPSFARMIFDTAGCGRRQGSALRSDQRAEERAPLTAVLADQIVHLSGAKERKKAQSRTVATSPLTFMTFS